MSTLSSLVRAVLAARQTRDEIASRAFGPAAAWDDVTLLVYGWPAGDRERSLARLAPGLARRWRLFGELGPALADRAARSGRPRDAEKLLLVRTGLLLAVSDVRREQRIRFGSSWIVEKDGVPAVVRPEKLRAAWLVRWLKAAALSAAEAVLLDAAWPAPDGKAPAFVPLEKSVRAAEAVWPDVEAVLNREDAAAELKELRLRAGLTPALEELLDAALATDSWAEAAELLDLRGAAARKRQERLLSALRAADVTGGGGSDEEDRGPDRVAL